MTEKSNEQNLKKCRIESKSEKRRSRRENSPKKIDVTPFVDLEQAEQENSRIFVK